MNPKMTGTITFTNVAQTEQNPLKSTLHWFYLPQPPLCWTKSCLHLIRKRKCTFGECINYYCTCTLVYTSVLYINTDWRYNGVHCCMSINNVIYQYTVVYDCVYQCKHRHILMYWDLLLCEHWPTHVYIL